jgi:hypothetical protein
VPAGSRVRYAELRWADIQAETVSGAAEVEEPQGRLARAVRPRGEAGSAIRC